MHEDRRVVTDDGVSIAYGDFGPRHGRTLVLLHGLAAAGAQFEADAHYFAAKGFRVLVPDVRGHGRSDKPTPMRQDGFSIPCLAADMLAVLDDAGADQVDWVGNSLGGILAFYLLPTHAARFRTLTTFGTAHRLGLPRVAATAIPLGYRLLGPKLLSMLGGVGTTRNRAARPLITRMLHDFDPLVGHAVAESVRRYDLTENALGYAGPLLLVRGGLDRPVNLALRGTLPEFSGHSNFTLIDLPDAGHCANLDVPEKLRATLERFWGANA